MGCSKGLQEEEKGETGEKDMDEAYSEGQAEEGTDGKILEVEDTDPSSGAELRNLGCNLNGDEDENNSRCTAVAPAQLPSTRQSPHFGVAECSGLIGLTARLVHRAAELAAWDEARKHAVKQILEGRTETTEIRDLPSPLVAKLLRPKGYILPGNGDVQLLGTGSFGRVFKARRATDGRILAVKRQFLGESAHDVVPVLRETSILNVLKSAPNVVQMQDAFLVRPASGAAEVWTVLEYFPHNLKRAYYHFRSEEIVQRLAFQVLLGLHSLHTADVIHRDLKPENLLVDLGARPPKTLRVAICDFGMSRSVHGFACFQDGAAASPGACPQTYEPFVRKLSDRVTSSWWRAPEMWGWADTRQMTKQDLKSLDVFAFGLVWAGLIARRSVITHEEGVDPPKFRLLEILRNVDQPAAAELASLGFSADVALFVRRVLSGDMDEVRAEMTSAEWPANRSEREAMLDASSVGIREWVRRKSRGLLPDDSCAFALMEDATRFSYRKRPPVEQLLADEYFDELRDETPTLRLWATDREAPQLHDVGEALEIEHKRQHTAAERARQLRGMRTDDSDTCDGTSSCSTSDSDSDDEPVRSNAAGPAARQAEDYFIDRIVSNAAATIEESVRSVCDLVRAELDLATKSAYL